MHAPDCRGKPGFNLAAEKCCPPQLHELAECLQKAGAGKTVLLQPVSNNCFFSLFISLWLFGLFPRRGKQQMLEKSAGITQHQGCNSSSYHPLLCLPRFLWQQTEVNLLLLLIIVNNTRTVSAATLAGVCLPHTGGVPRSDRAKPSNKSMFRGAHSQHV